MLKNKHNIPLDYTLCDQTATVYHREGLTRRVLQNVHYEFTDTLDTALGVGSHSRSFLLVIPGPDPIAVGDKVVLGIGPENLPWEALNTAHFPTLGQVRTVKPRYFRGTLCHTEARG